MTDVLKKTINEFYDKFASNQNLMREIRDSNAQYTIIITFTIHKNILHNYLLSKPQNKGALKSPLIINLNEIISSTTK